MKRNIENRSFDEERALYGSRHLLLRHCAFEGPADGESALKEATDIKVKDTRCCLRYPFWHDRRLSLEDCVLTDTCRAALWYSEEVTAKSCRFHGIKAFRECRCVSLSDCDICSLEFGWYCHDVQITHTEAEGEYFMMRSERLRFSEVTLTGKYSFQYCRDSAFDHCVFHTKDAFWHAKNVTVSDCTLSGEYLAWYAESLTLIRCRISGTQPFCYCKNLKLIDCEMNDADLCFERSEVNATLTAPVISIKNPRCGQITVPAVGELIFDDIKAKGKVTVTGEKAEKPLL